MGGKRLTKEQLEINIKDVCQSKNYDFIKWKEGFKNKESRIVISCGAHGEWDTKCYHFLNGSGCPICAGTRTTSERRHIQIKDKLKDSKSKLIKFKNTFQNGSSVCLLNCGVHGEWEATVNRLMFGSVDCPLCVTNRQKTKQEREIEIINRCKETGLFLNHIFDEYPTWRSKISLKCSIHGNFITTINSFISKQKGCPNCSKTGFKPGKYATLYVLRSACGCYVKIGISNHVDQRLNTLYRKTPFDFQVIEKLNGHGTTIRSLEKDFHSHFESAGLTGFDGCTEWLKWNPNITTLIRIL
ncbi:TPA: GIY-YIG nuclease family protein [Salmonella enterica subsp. enterica serovar Javiana]